MEKIMYWSTLEFINFKMNVKFCSDRLFKKKPTQDSISPHPFRQKNHTAQARKIFLYQEVIGFNRRKILPGERYLRALACHFFARKSLWEHFLAMLSDQKVPGGTFWRYFQIKNLWARLFGNLFATERKLKWFFTILFMVKMF